MQIRSLQLNEISQTTSYESGWIVGESSSPTSQSAGPGQVKPVTGGLESVPNRFEVENSDRSWPFPGSGYMVAVTEHYSDCTNCSATWTL